MSAANFKAAIAAATPKPKAVLVTPELFRELERENAINKRLGTPWGLPTPNLGISLPFYDGDVFISCDPSLESEGVDFKLPG